MSRKACRGGVRSVARGVFDASAWLGVRVAYSVNDNLALQLNVEITDEVYLERVRNNANSGWATPGAARFAVLSITWKL